MRVLSVKPVSVGYTLLAVISNLLHGHMHDPHEVAYIRIVIEGTPLELMSDAAIRMATSAAVPHTGGCCVGYAKPIDAPFVNYRTWRRTFELKV